MAEQVPEPGVQLVFRAQRHESWELLAEALANSFGANRGRANRVDIFWSRRDRTLAVLDNGRGFGYEMKDGRSADLGLLFKLGGGAGLAEGLSNDDLGRFGAGGSIFILNLADVAELWTLADGLVSHTRQDVHQTVDVRNVYFDVLDEWERSTVNNTPAELSANRHGTLIVLKVRKGKHITGHVIQAYLAKRFSEKLRKGSKIVWHEVDTDEEIALTPWDPGKLEYLAEEDIEVQGLKAKVKAGYAPSVTEREAGIEILFGTQTIEITKQPLLPYTGGKVYGWVYLDLPDWRDQLNANKTGFINDELADDLYDRVHTALADVLAFVEEQDIEEWAADLALEAKLQFGTIAKMIEKNEFPDTAKWQPHDPPRPRKKRKKTEGEEEDEKSSTSIKIKPDTSGTLGRFAKVTITPGKPVEVRFDATNDTMKLARRPLNKPFFRFVVVDEFAAELIRKELVVRSGLYSEEEWESLRAQVGDDELLLASMVKPKLFGLVQPA